MRSILLVITTLVTLTACISDYQVSEESAWAADAQLVETDIISVLQIQAEAWNRGDIDAFMDGYWKSDQLRFASGGTVTYGWAETTARYKSRYADRAAMGQLAFSDMETVVLGDDGAILHGRWALERAEDRPNGLFTLVKFPSPDFRL